MLRGLKKPQILLALVISLSVPVLSGYLLYCDLAEGDFFSPDLNIEAYDQEYLLATNLSELKGSQSGVFFNEFQLTTYLFRLPSYLSSQISSLDQKTIILRC